MTNLDLLLLGIYFIVVFRVIYQAFKSLSEKFSIQVDQSLLDQDLQNKRFEETCLKDLISIKFKFKDRYNLDELKQVSINVENKTDDRSLYVDWDRSSLTDLGGRSRRVIRLTPNMMIDLFQSQAPSIIAPGGTLREDITAEDLLKPKDANPEILEVSGLLVDIGKLGDKKSSQTDKQRHASFMSRQGALDFTLRLAVRSSDPYTGIPSQTVYLLCKFILKKLPWTDAFPWNQKKF